MKYKFAANRKGRTTSQYLPIHGEIDAGIAFQIEGSVPSNKLKILLQKHGKNRYWDEPVFQTKGNLVIFPILLTDDEKEHVSRSTTEHREKYSKDQVFELEMRLIEIVKRLKKEIGGNITDIKHVLDSHIISPPN